MDKNIIILKIKDKPEVLCGLMPPDNGMKAALERCYSIVAKDPTKHIHYDIETGWPTVITKEQHEAMIETWNACLPKLEGFVPDKLFIYGTGGNMEKGDGSFEDIFKNPAK